MYHDCLLIKHIENLCDQKHLYHQMLKLILYILHAMVVGQLNM